METILKNKNRNDANRLADAVQKMTIEEQKNLAAFMAGVQYAAIIKPIHNSGNAEN